MATTDKTPSFAQDIQPLFRQDDREVMIYAFDLWDYADVCTHADAILERIEDGSMPCDMEWSEAQITLLHSWIDAGMPA
jgi:hypothetical protein